MKSLILTTLLLCVAATASACGPRSEDGLDPPEQNATCDDTDAGDATPCAPHLPMPVQTGTP